MKRTRVVVFGLDCAPPQWVFKTWRKELPALDRLMRQGFHGPLRSSDPPITIPAWSVMLSGKTPADLASYGFKTRRPGSYFENEYQTADKVSQKRVWDYLGEHGLRSLLVGVPQTYPVRPMKGWMLSGFLAPVLDARAAYPEDLLEEIRGLCPSYAFDIPQYRSCDKAELLTKLNRMTDEHFRCFEHLLKTKPWDFAMVVEIGTDRIQHCFWQDMDPAHPRHDPGTKFATAVLDYYRGIDRWIGKITAALDEDTRVLIVSDHGAKAMQGGIAINEWLYEKGYLRLRAYPPRQTPLEAAEVDWKHTTAWAAGGYAGRVYLNVQGREAEGIVAKDDYERIRRRLAGELAKIRGRDAKRLKTRVYTPEKLYGVRTPEAPDLMVYFDDLNYRALGTLGSRQVVRLENDAGPDGANHDYEGILIAAGPGIRKQEKAVKGLKLADVAAMILQCYGLRPDVLKKSRPLQKLVQAGPQKTLADHEKRMLDERLRSLGYLG